MQKFILALFSVVALLGLVVPSFAHVERNGNRLARGLPPLPPARRGSAKRSSPSYVHKPHGHHHDHPTRRGSAKRSSPSNVHKPHGHHTDRIQLRDKNGTPFGFLTDFTGSGGDLYVTYYPGLHSLSFHGQGASDAHFLGVSASNTDLGPTSSAYVLITNVAMNDNKANAHIWTLSGNGQLIPVWQNHDGTSTPVDLCLNTAEGAIALTGDPSSLPSGWEQVEFYLVK